MRSLPSKLWLFFTCAQMPLSTEELREALGVEVGEPEFDPDNYPDIEDVLASCLGLVTVDDDSGIVRLVHYTTQEYLERTLDWWFPDAHAMITDVCISYLSLDRYADPTFLSFEKDSAWYAYAAAHWSDHAREAPSSLGRVISFLTRQVNVTKSALYTEGAVLRVPGHLMPDVVSYPYTTGLHMAVRFDLLDATVALLQQGFYPTLRDEAGVTPLFVALELDRKTLVGKLLEYTPINARMDYFKCTALHVAAMFGRVSVVKQVLDGGADINLKNIHGETPLHFAVRYLATEIVRILLNAKADHNTRNSYGVSPLQAAIGRCQNQDVGIAIAKALLDAGANINSLDKEGYTAYQTALKGENLRLAQYLLERGADPRLGVQHRPDSAMEPSNETASNGPSES